MRTPAGTECPYFYGNYFRGQFHEECRLIGNVPPPHDWTRDLCSVCPVPRISMANSCEFMILTPTVHKGVLGIGKKVTITAFCRKANADVKVPEIGCGICHPIGLIDTPKKTG